MKTKLTVCLLVLTLGSASSTFAYEENSMGTIADVLVVRPACFVATAIGSALFLLALPVCATSKSIKKTANVLVVAPAQATFTRPVGDYTSLDDRLKK